MQIDPRQLSQPERYKLATGAVVPRPIAWVSTMNDDGTLNLAPFSFFNVAATNPLTLLFCPQVVQVGQTKDTLRNIRARQEFVINLPDEQTLEAMNLCATELPYGQSEFEWADVTPAESIEIGVPRVAEAVVAFECRLRGTVPLGDAIGSGTVVLGEVACVHIRDDVYQNGYVLLDRLRPVARIGGDNYALIRETINLKRVPVP